MRRSLAQLERAQVTAKRASAAATADRGRAWAGNIASEVANVAAADAGAESAPTLSLVTRVETRVAWEQLVIAVAFVQMKRRSRGVEGLIGTSLIRDRRSMTIVSLWANEQALGDFATAVPKHLLVVRWVRRRRLRTWSALYDLIGASPMSDDWAEAAPRKKVRRRMS